MRLPTPSSHWQALSWALGVSIGLHLVTWLAWLPFALKSQLFSFALLVPPFCAYLVGSSAQRREAPGPAAPGWALGFALLSLGLAWGSGSWTAPAAPAAQQTWLTWRLASWVTTLWALASWWGGVALWRTFTFPLLYLLAVIPLTPAAEHTLEVLLQHGSASVLAVFLQLTGPVFFRQEMLFQVPGLAIEVAPECAGTNSTVVLFLVSWVAGYLFLRAPWRRALLVAAVIPLALCRNAFRIWVLVQLAVHDDPKWIDSALHHQGGPLFFLLSLIPFGALLFWLSRRERRAVT